MQQPGACFVEARARAMARLHDTSLDKAPAGGVDVAARPLVAAVNAHARYFTTSTCAGRCAVYASPAGRGDQKRRGKWLFMSHDGVAGGRRAVPRRHRRGSEAERRGLNCALKYEPPIAHVRCASLDAAKRLLVVAVGCGYASGCTDARRAGRRRAVRRRRHGRAPRRLVRGRRAGRRPGRPARPLDQDAGPPADREAREARAKAVKVALELRGAFRKAFNVTPRDGGLAVPCSDDGADALEMEDHPLRAAVVDALDGRELVVVRVDAPRGDALLVPAALPAADDDVEFWDAVATAAGCAKVFRDAEVAPDGIRSSNRTLLRGPGGADDAWVAIREGGVVYGFDATATMFAKGNNTERMRHGTFACAGETVVDLYAGIGYFSLPLLIKGGAAFAHCCEWAPRTAEALRRNLIANGVDASRYAVHAGDNAAAAPKLAGLADRVSLGLTPTSRAGWPLACLVLRDAGGVCHVHENVKVRGDGAAADRAEFDAWGAAVAAEFARLFAAAGRGAWACDCAFVSRVRTRAPRPPPRRRRRLPAAETKSGPS
ncbi:hypothetical protein JL722_11432 [Aureococcus anophagefferens]|nr:hypothetical protein JL722_11432 [Aureococcus anophagefferens]